MFLMLSIITFISVYLGQYQLWFGLLMGFLLHLLIHIGQWIAFKRYVPVVITSFLALPYCLYTLNVIIKNQLFDYTTIIFWTFIGLMVILGVMMVIQWLMPRFSQWLERFGEGDIKL